MAYREEFNIEEVLTASDEHLLAQMLAGATGLRTTIAHEGPVIDRDPTAGARHAAMVALQRFGFTPEAGAAPEGDY